MILWNKNDKPENITIFNNLDYAPNGKKVSNNIVDELLLSANDLNIYGKSTLIEYNYRDNEPIGDLLIQQIKADPKKAYQIILKNKLDKLKRAQQTISDFNVKPVPK